MARWTRFVLRRRRTISRVWLAVLGGSLAAIAGAFGKSPGDRPRGR